MTPDAPRRQRLAPEVRRRQVLDAAVAVFSEEGFHAASMEAVATRAGVSKPSVYAHGGTKEELFALCVRREGERLLRTVTAAVGGGGGPVPAPEIRLWLGMRAFFTAVTTRRAGWTVLYRQAASGAFAGEIAAMRAVIVDGVAALLAEGLSDGERADPDAAEVAALAHTLVGAAEGLADWWLSSGSTSTGGPDDAGGSGDRGADPAGDLARTIMSVVWPGIDARRRGQVWQPSIAPSTAVSPDR